MSLINGAALIIEDLDVTMKCVTFTCPQYATHREVERLCRKLKNRKIEYTLTYREPKPMLWNYRIVVGNRDLLFLALWP